MHISRASATSFERGSPRDKANPWALAFEGMIRTLAASLALADLAAELDAAVREG